MYVLCFKGKVSGDIELNPGPVVTQGNNPNNIELLQSRLAQHGMVVMQKEI